MTQPAEGRTENITRMKRICFELEVENRHILFCPVIFNHSVFVFEFVFVLFFWVQAMSLVHLSDQRGQKK